MKYGITIRFCLLITMATLMVTAVATAQDNPEPKKFDNPEWKRVVLVDYHPGKTGKAMEIIKNYYKKTDAKIGSSGPDMELMLYSGEYDFMLIWSMEDGLEEMNWEVSPRGIEWQKAFEELAGGKEEAQKIRDDYSSYVRSSTSYLTRVATAELGK